MTPAEIEPETFRFVAQHLNHCAPRSHYLITNFKSYLRSNDKARIASEADISVIFFYWNSDLQGSCSNVT